jgi:hypothetical protein
LCLDGLHRHCRFADDEGSVAGHFVAFEVRSLILASLIPPPRWFRRGLILSRVRAFGVFDLVCLAGQPSREPAELPETNRVFSHRPVLHSNALSLECVGLSSCAVHASEKIRQVQLSGEHAAYRGLIRPCELMTLCHGTFPSCRRSDGLFGRCFRAMPTCLWMGSACAHHGLLSSRYYLGHSAKENVRLVIEKIHFPDSRRPISLAM